MNNKFIFFLISLLFVLISLACEKQPPQEIKTKYHAYLHIETTGLNIVENDLIIIGVYLEKPVKPEFIQLIDKEITSAKVLEIFKDVDTLYTYNGERFSLSFIKKKLNIDLTECCKHIDLMKVCHNKNLYGTLEQVEKELGISRKSKLDGGYVARLWIKHKDDKEVINSILEYNKENTLNLSKLNDALTKY
jgi:uncharacterized protein YprB with RNaseH-like and TPR domain